MKKCNHEKKCVECIKQEIAELEARLVKLKDQLPADQQLLDKLKDLQRQKEYIPIPYPVTPQQYSVYPTVTWTNNLC